MNDVYFPKTALLLFLGVGIVLSVPPLFEIFRLFQKLDLSNLHDVFAQTKEVKQYLKSLITYGMLLILGFFTLLYTYLSYIVEPVLRKACLVVLGVLFIGGLGFIVQPNHQVSYRFVNYPTEDMFLNQAVLTVKFTKIPNDLDLDFQKALSDEVDIFITPKFVHTSDYREVPIAFNKKTLISNKDYKLSNDEIKTFLTNKSLVFKVDYPQSTLMVRDLKGSPLEEREDECRIQGKIVNIPYDKALWFYFKVQHKNGKPIRVYY